MKTFLKVFVSIIIVILIIGIEMGIGGLFCIQSVLNEKSISNAVQKIDVNSLMHDGEALNEFGEEIDKSFKEIGLSIEEAEEILDTPTLKKVFGDYLGSVLISTIDETTEVIYPTKKDIEKILGECYDVASEKTELELTKEETIALTDDFYDDIIASLKDLEKDLKSDMEEE